MTATEPKPAPEPLDPKDYEITCLKLRNEQLHLLVEAIWKELREARKEPPP